MAEKKQGFLKRLFDGMAKTRNNIVSKLDDLFSGGTIDDDFYEELEEILITADIGVKTTMNIIEHLEERVEEDNIKDPKLCKEILMESIRKQMDLGENAYEFENRKSVVLVIGVNGVGKTTSIGKLAGQLTGMGKTVLLAAADTFRAGAIEQLDQWAKRANVPIIAHSEGADPAAVIYDAVQSAKSKKTDILICDTAGRLHNKKNLMEELKKINRIIDKDYPEAYRETLIVLDGTTGQNALVQAREFMEAAEITGIVLTKMDGTAKGGIAVAIQSELGVPVKYIGVGEKIEDLQKFNAENYVNALFTEVEFEEEDVDEVPADMNESNMAETGKAESDMAEASVPESDQSESGIDLAESSKSDTAAHISESELIAAEGGTEHEIKDIESAGSESAGYETSDLESEDKAADSIKPESAANKASEESGEKPGDESIEKPAGEAVSDDEAESYELAISPYDVFTSGFFRSQRALDLMTEEILDSSEFNIKTFDFDRYRFK